MGRSESWGEGLDWNWQETWGARSQFNSAWMRYISKCFEEGLVMLKVTKIALQESARKWNNV